MIVRFFQRPAAVFFGALLAILLTSCTDPITVGSDLLGGDRATIGFDANVPIDLRTFPEDSLRIYDASANQDITRVFFGSIEDDVFGKTKRSFYLIPELRRSSASGLVVKPQFAGTDTVSIDSVVVIIPLDTGLFYGSALSLPMPYEVRELLMGQGPDLSEDEYSSAEYPVQSMTLATGSFSPTKAQTLVHDTLVIDSTLSTHLRINLDPAFAQRFLAADTSIYESDSTLREFFPGLLVEPSSASGGFFGMRANSGFAGIYFYVSTQGREPSFHSFPLEITVPSYRFDRDASLAGGLLDQSVNNERAAVEGVAGLTAVVEVTDVESLRDKVINLAELEIYLDEIEGYNYSAFAPVQQIALYYPDSDGFLVPIQDAGTILGNSGSDIRNFFLGGVLETDEDNGKRVYRANLSVHLQAIVEGDVSPLIYVRASPLDQEVGRSVLLGPEAAEFPMRLKVAFTDF